MDLLPTTIELFSKIPFTLFDYILFLCFGFYIYEEVSLGAKAALSHAAAIVAGFTAGLFFYAHMSNFLTASLSFSKGTADAVSFLIIAVLIYALISKLIFFLGKKASGIVPHHFSKLTAFLAGSVSFILIASFIVAIFLSFPMALPIKSGIKNSVTGKFLFTKTQNVELAVKQVFGDTISETLNFLTVKPDSDGTVALHFTTSNVTIDDTSEQQMLEMLNNTREEHGLGVVSMDSGLRNVARLHARDMFSRGYFSHYTPEGYTPFDRLENLSINYTAAAENLAYAPEVDLAFSGLMKSPGHRRNILDPAFTKIGIGVIDAGIHGKMFVQEFTD